MVSFDFDRDFWRYSRGTFLVCFLGTFGDSHCGLSVAVDTPLGCLLWPLVLKVVKEVHVDIGPQVVSFIRIATISADL